MAAWIESHGHWWTVITSFPSMTSRLSSMFWHKKSTWWEWHFQAGNEAGKERISLKSLRFKMKTKQISSQCIYLALLTGLELGTFSHFSPLGHLKEVVRLDPWHLSWTISPCLMPFGVEMGHGWSLYTPNTRQKTQRKKLSQWLPSNGFFKNLGRTSKIRLRGD